MALQRQRTCALLLVSILLLSSAVRAAELTQRTSDEGAGAAAREPFDAWLAGVREEAILRGLRAEVVDRALEGVAPIEQILHRDRRQTEFVLTLDQYLTRRLTAPTVRMARRMAARYPTLLKRVSEAYGVDPRIVVSVWGLESNFGRFTGVRPVIPTLATLGWDGRRGDLFRRELLDALTILDQGHISQARLKGSWAGAMGQTQFLPSSYLQWAVDFDEDGRRDIWSSLPDVFASIGNYLLGHGWVSGLPWGYEVRIPDEAAESMSALPRRDRGCQAVRLLTSPEPLRQWRERGVVRSSGERVPASDHEASLLQLDGRSFLVTVNYEALLGYNCAHRYALSVALLADRIPPID